LTNLSFDKTTKIGKRRRKSNKRARIYREAIIEQTCDIFLRIEYEWRSKRILLDFRQGFRYEKTEKDKAVKSFMTRFNQKNKYFLSFIR